MIEQSKMPNALDYLNTLQPKEVSDSITVVKFNKPWDTNYTEQELDIARQIKEQWWTKDDFINEIDIIRKEQFQGKEDIQPDPIPDLMTKDEIKKSPSLFKQFSSLWSSVFRETWEQEREQLRQTIRDKDSGVYNFLWGSATGLIETAGLAWSAIEFWENLETAPLNVFYKNLPDNVKDIVKDYLPENVTRQNPFEWTLDPLKASTELKNDIQESIWVNTESGFTTVGEFLTPDTYLGIGALAKWTVKLVPKVVNWVRQNAWDIAEYFVKLSSGLRKEGIELDINLLKQNPKLALEKSNIQPEQILEMLDDLKTQLPKNATKELDQIENIKSELTSSILQKQSTKIDEAARLWDEVSVELANTAEQAKANLAKKADELQLTWEWYQKFVWKESWLNWQALSKDFIDNIKNANPLMWTEWKNALKVVQDEIDIIVDAVNKRDWIFRYEDLHALRKNIDNKINWWDLTASTKNKFIKQFRKRFDEDIMEANFKWLKEVDAKYATKLWEIEEMQKVLWKGWEESNAFRKTLLTLHKPWNEKKLEETANLLWIDSFELKTLSKNLADDAAASTKNINVSTEINKIDRVKDFEQLQQVVNDIGGQNLDELEKLSKENGYMANFVKAIKADKAKSEISWNKDIWENFVASIFKAMETPRGTTAWNDADVALAYIEKKLGKQKFEELKIIKSLYKIKAVNNEGTFASLAFNLASVKAGAFAPLLKAFIKNPEEGLEYVLKRANRAEQRKIKAIEAKMREWKELLSKEITDFWNLLLKYSFATKTTSNVLDNE